MSIDTPLKVALFMDTDAFAGTERHVLDLALGLRDTGVAVSVACPVPSPLNDKVTAAGMKTIQVQKCGFADRQTVRNLGRMIASRELDIVHAHNGRTALSSALAVTIARRGAAVATQHFLEPNHTNDRGPKALVGAYAHRLVGRKTAHTIAISDAVLAAMRKRNEVPENRMSVVMNGIATPEQTQLRSAQSVREELGIPPLASLVFCAARLEREKDVSSLITAMHSVTKQFPNAFCAIAGTGSLRDRLAAEIAEQDLQSHVRLLGFRNDVLSLINACDLFVLPSLAEPFGLVILEAMSLAKPVIATAAGGPCEIVAHGETGILVKPGHSPDLAEAIHRLISKPDVMVAMGAAGQKRFYERFTSIRMARETLDIYTKIGI